VSWLRSARRAPAGARERDPGAPAPTAACRSRATARRARFHPDDVVTSLGEEQAPPRSRRCVPLQRSVERQRVAPPAAIPRRTRRAAARRSSAQSRPRYWRSGRGTPATSTASRACTSQPSAAGSSAGVKPSRPSPVSTWMCPRRRTPAARSAGTKRACPGSAIATSTFARASSTASSASTAPSTSTCRCGPPLRRLDFPDGQGVAASITLERVAGRPRGGEDLGESVAVRVSLEDAAQAHSGAEHLAEDRRVVRQRAPVDSSQEASAGKRVPIGAECSSGAAGWRKKC